MSFIINHLYGRKFKMISKFAIIGIFAFFLFVCKKQLAKDMVEWSNLLEISDPNDINFIKGISVNFSNKSDEFIRSVKFIFKVESVEIDVNKSNQVYAEECDIEINLKPKEKHNYQISLKKSVNTNYPKVRYTINFLSYQ